ncbi:MAG: hypothetical protein KC466_15775, partial [Myxococcales bacterium]|nr:hypothetical protein [Myxococcales bacterium]
GGGGGDDHGGGRHGKKWESFKSKFVSDTETWTGAVPVDANSPMKVENSDLAITAVAGQTVTFTISGANKLNSNSSFMVTIGSDEFTGCIHTSCSQPLYVGQVFGTYFEVTALSGANVDTDNPFCQ